jgi:hypothetical protein
MPVHSIFPSESEERSRPRTVELMIGILNSVRLGNLFSLPCGRQVLVQDLTGLDAMVQVHPRVAKAISFHASGTRAAESLSLKQICQGASPCRSTSLNYDFRFTIYESDDFSMSDSSFVNLKS